MKDLNHKKRWFNYAVFGLILTGAGLSLAIDAGMYRLSNPPTANWVVYGTCALIVFNSGLCFIGQSIVHKIKANE
jgi:hypothetical protein